MDDLLRERAREARARIRTGELRGAALREVIVGVPPRDRDAFVDVFLALDEAEAEDVALPRGAVPYLPCGVDTVLALTDTLPLQGGDLFVDLGSGLGRVVLLVHLLTGASGRGIEIQPHLVATARAAAMALALREVTFVHANAADADLEGDAFFLYAPFNGPMLADVLGRIEVAARRRAVVVATVDLDLAAVPWLARRATSSAALSLYDASGLVSAWGPGGPPRTS